MPITISPTKLLVNLTMLPFLFSSARNGTHSPSQNLGLPVIVADISSSMPDNSKSPSKSVNSVLESRFLLTHPHHDGRQQDKPVVVCPARLNTPD